METSAQVPTNNLNPYASSAPTATATLPPPERDAAPADKVSVEKPGPSALDKYNTVAGVVSSAVQKGLSYANARRARETYKPVRFSNPE